eukprot:9478953-Pyramimonas_sp.AAC.1
MPSAGRSHAPLQLAPRHKVVQVAAACRPGPEQAAQDEARRGVLAMRSLGGVRRLRGPPGSRGARVLRDTRGSICSVRAPALRGGRRGGAPE